MDPLALDSFVAGILLGATATGDAEATCAALDPALRGHVGEVARALAGERATRREAAVSALVAAAAPRVGDAPAPPRARAVIAALVSRERGTAWIREAGTPRAGFRASPALRVTIAATEDDAWHA